MTEKERIEKDVGIKSGDAWEHVIICVLLWLEKKLIAREKKCTCAGCICAR